MKMKILKHYRPNGKMNHASWTIMKILKYKGQRGKKKNQTSKAKIKILKCKYLKSKKKKKIKL